MALPWGTCFSLNISDLTDPRPGILHFFVRPDCWRQGYGTQLMGMVCRDMDRFNM